MIYKAYLFFFSGMDPAGPLFESYSDDVKLDKSDAKFVDVIHTDAVPLAETGKTIQLTPT